jgi:hypothetical protein
MGDTTAPTANLAAASADTSVGPECITRIAMRGNAPHPRHVPNVLTAYDVQSQVNYSDRLADGSLTLEQLTAFAITEDHARQEAVF